MSELEDLAAEAQIVIVGSGLNDGGDSSANVQDTLVGAGGRSSLQSVNPSGDSSADLSNIEALNALFGHRYTDDDPDYLRTVETSEAMSRPPCVEDFFVRRQRDDRWKHRGGGRGYNHHRGAGDRAFQGGRDDFGGDRNRHHGFRGGWGGGDYRRRGHSSDRGYDSRRDTGKGDSDRRDGRSRSPHR
ncbi:hypothetical protein EGW08_012348 [Elysia chlorotica]|uniref:Uncharacterized protein n=1 Tax=Elysia chlorotica TaxID=188477 RepID=A0A3S0ZKJ0_ELYCH|nr:hypothetical protein EGW08_012348 [Elysia chlorotica]